MLRSLARRRFALTPATPGGGDGGAATGRDVETRAGVQPPLSLVSSGKRLPGGWVRLTLELQVHAGDAALGWLLAEPADGASDVVRFPVHPSPDGPVETFVRLPDRVRALRLTPIAGGGTYALGRIEAQEVGRTEVVVRRLIAYCRGERLDPRGALRAALRHVRVYGVRDLWAWMSGNSRNAGVGGAAVDIGYGAWAANNLTWSADERRVLARRAEGLPRRPLLSVLMPVYDTPERWLRAAIDSVRTQSYPHWELCVCDDASPAPHVARVLASYAELDPRIRITRRATNGRIAAATNDTLAAATGAYVCLMDHDDVLTPDALLAFAEALNDDPDADLLYSDEDRIGVDGAPLDPILKPGWSPELLETHNYIGHLACYRTEIAREIGGFRGAFDGAQDYDFTLRFAEASGRVHHVPRILYRWRAVPGSVAASIDEKGYVVAAGRRALEARLEREGAHGTVTLEPVGGWYHVARAVAGSPRVSLVLERDAHAEEVRAATTYRDLEIVGAPGASSDPAGALDEAAARARGDFLLFLASDVEVVTGDWIEQMLRLAQRPGVGAVGAKQLFADGTLRHVGFTFVDGLPHDVRRGYPGSDWGRNGSSAVARNVLAVDGAAMLVRRSAFLEAGGFEAALAPAFHDVGLCLALVDRGLRSVVAPRAVVRRLGPDTRYTHLRGPAAEDLVARWAHLTRPDPYYPALLTRTPPTFEFRDGEA